MTKIIDNSKEKLSATLNNAFEDANDIAIATAYFNVNGYGELKDALRNKPLKFLLGRAQTESIKWEDEIIRELEENEDERRYFELLQDAVEFFEGELVNVRALKGPFFHGKAYIGAVPALDNLKRGIGVVGSSNFTRGGLVTTRELNMLNTDREVVQELISWFQEAWKTSVDYKGQFISSLKNYVTTRSPYEVVAKALYATYESMLDTSAENQKILSTLMPHQKLSVRDALFILEKYNGVVIADATGLGKSRISLSLALNAIREGRKCLLIAPTSVIGTTWSQEFESTHLHIKTVSTEKLSSDPDYLNRDEFSDVGFVIVDEAHDYRHASTNRYGALRDMLLRNRAQVVLMTATPVNNSLMDIYSLMSLYLPEDSIVDMHKETLKGFFTSSQKKWINGEQIEMEDVLERFMVRHSRRLAIALGEGKLNFPERVLDSDPRTRYDADVDYEKMDTLLESLNFAFYDLSIEKLANHLKMPDGTPLPRDAEKAQRDKLKKLVKRIVIINMFKRLESSTTAFKGTLTSLLEYMANAVRYAKDKGYFVPPSFKNEPIFDFDEELPGVEELFKKPKYSEMKSRCKMNVSEVSAFAQACSQDEETMQKLLNLIPESDAKFDAFNSRLCDITGDMKDDKGNGAIIFSQFATTAQYIYGRLKDEVMQVPISLVTGGICYDNTGRQREKSDIIVDFQKKGGILVSTDVLSEGQNLQNAQYVFNYDFPWNPVVLIQRIGRIDRLGSRHRAVYVGNILPKNGDQNDPKSLEHFLSLMQRLFHKLDAIRETIGLDATTLGENAAPKDFGIQIAISKGDISAIETLSRELEQFTTDPMDTLAQMIQDNSLEWLQSIPDGVGAFKKGDRDALFILFSDGNDHYWKLRYFDGEDERVTSTNDIVATLMKGEVRNHGEKIDYGTLIDRMKKMKEDLRRELKERREREITLGGTPFRATKAIKGIFDALANSGVDGELLAIRFREASNSQSVVTALQRAMNEGKLLEKARDVLQDIAISDGNAQPVETEIKLKRVCWCWIQPTGFSNG